MIRNQCTMILLPIQQKILKWLWVVTMNTVAQSQMTLGWILKKEKKKFSFHCMRIDDNLQFIMLINNIKTLWNRTECFIILKQLWYESFWNKTSFWFLLQHIKAANEVHKTNPSKTYKCCIYGWEYNNFKSLKCLFVGRRKIK